MASGLARIRRTLGISLRLREPPKVPSYGWSYFDHLVAVYINLNTSDKRADAIIQKASDDADELTWGDIFLLENVILSRQPDAIVRRNAWILRERLRETACSTFYDKYIDSGPPKEADTPQKMALLRADLTRVLDVLHWHYSLIPIRERIRTSLTIRCIWFVLGYTVLLWVGLHQFLRHHWAAAAMASGVLYFGIIGGFVSSQRRMQTLPTDTDPLISIFGLDGAGYFLWLSPLLGAIFAVVLMLMFVAGFLQGTVFPTFANVLHDKAAVGFFDVAWHTLPVSSADYAKLYVWAFLAGFAERLVPDSLDRLAGKMNSSKQGVPPGPPGPPDDDNGDPPRTNLNEDGTAVIAPRVSAERPSRPSAPGDTGEPPKAVATETLQAALHTGVVPPEVKESEE